VLSSGSNAPPCSNLRHSPTPSASTFAVLQHKTQKRHSQSLRNKGRRTHVAIRKLTAISALSHATGTGTEAETRLARVSAITRVLSSYGSGNAHEAATRVGRSVGCIAPGIRCRLVRASIRTATEVRSVLARLSATLLPDAWHIRAPHERGKPAIFSEACMLMLAFGPAALALIDTEVNNVLPAGAQAATTRCVRVAEGNLLGILGTVGAAHVDVVLQRPVCHLLARHVVLDGASELGIAPAALFRRPSVQSLPNCTAGAGRGQSRPASSTTCASRCSRCPYRLAHQHDNRVSVQQKLPSGDDTT